VLGSNLVLGSKFMLGALKWRSGCTANSLFLHSFLFSRGHDLMGGLTTKKDNQYVLTKSPM
jgi:hypothetical protein